MYRSKAWHIFTSLPLRLACEAMEAIGGDLDHKGKGNEVFTYHFSQYTSPEEMWKKLLEYDKGNYLMASTATRCKSETDCGMVHGHAYSILHAVEIEGQRLIACRASSSGKNFYRMAIERSKMSMF